MIAENAGLDGTVVVNTIRKSKEKNYGYDALKAVYGDLRKAGIVDPVKVTRSALQNGASVACLLLTTESLVADIPEKGKKDDHHDDHHGGGRHGCGMGEDGVDGSVVVAWARHGNEYGYEPSRELWLCAARHCRPRKSVPSANGANVACLLLTTNHWCDIPERARRTTNMTTTSAA